MCSDIIALIEGVKLNMNKKSKYLRGIIAITLLTSIPVFVPGIVSPFQNTEVKADSETDTKTIAINTGGDLVVNVGDPAVLSDQGKGSLEITDDFAKDANNSDKLSTMETANYGFLYKSIQNALTASGPYTAAINADGTWKTPGVYYQNISYKIYYSGDSDLDKMITDPSNSGYTVTINGETATEGPSADNNYYIKSIDKPTDTALWTISVVRKITVEGGNVTIPSSLENAQYRIGDDKKFDPSDVPNVKLMFNDIQLNKDGSYKLVTGTGGQISYYAKNPLNAGSVNENVKALNDSTTGSVADVLNKKGVYYRIVSVKLDTSKINDTKLYTFGDHYKIIGGISPTVQLVQKVTIIANKDAKASIKDLSVTEGTKTTDKSLTDLSSDQLTQSKDAGDGSSMAATPTTDGKYYDADPLAEDSKAKEVSDPLKTEGTYYRLLTFTLNDDINPDDFNFDGGKLSDDNKTVQYTQKVVVSPKPKSSGSSSSHHSESWTTKSQPGIVTTHSDQAYYTLYNDADKVVSNRALAKKTSWYTDRSRTDQYGNVQYHVATDEWINASSVTFNQEPVVSQGLKNIKEDSGILYADKEANYYLLYDKNDKQISNRALGPNSYWKVDQTATDNSGNTYYRVATNEWVKQSDGISFK